MSERERKECLKVVIRFTSENNPNLAEFLNETVGKAVETVLLEKMEKESDFLKDPFFRSLSVFWGVRAKAYFLLTLFEGLINVAKEESKREGKALTLEQKNSRIRRYDKKWYT